MNGKITEAYVIAGVYMYIEPKMATLLDDGFPLCGMVNYKI